MCNRIPNVDKECVVWVVTGCKRWGVWLIQDHHHRSMFPSDQTNLIKFALVKWLGFLARLVQYQKWGIHNYLPYHILFLIIVENWSKWDQSEVNPIVQKIFYIIFPD